MNDCKEKKCLNENEYPEFFALLNALKNQLALMDENSSLIFDRINFIRTVREPDEEGMISKEPCGLLDELWLCVDRMKLYNYELIKSKKALIRFFG